MEAGAARESLLAIYNTNARFKPSIWKVSYNQDQQAELLSVLDLIRINGHLVQTGYFDHDEINCVLLLLAMTGTFTSLQATPVLDERGTSIARKSSIERRAYHIGGYGTAGGQLPAYCTGSLGRTTCKCSGIGVYGCTSSVTRIQLGGDKGLGVGCHE